MEDSRLIELVREHPCVFDAKHQLYRDAHVRDNVWAEIGLGMNLPAEECKNRWKNIRDTYMRRKRGKKLPTGSSSSRKQRKWHLEEQLDFLNVVDCERETFTNADFSSCNVNLVEEGESETATTSGYREEEEYSHEPNRRKTKAGDGIMQAFRYNAEERTKLIENAYIKQKEDLFFKSMAKCLRELSVENQIVAKREVCNIVTDLQLKELRRNNHRR